MGIGILCNGFDVLGRICIRDEQMQWIRRLSVVFSHH